MIDMHNNSSDNDAPQCLKGKERGMKNICLKAGRKDGFVEDGRIIEALSTENMHWIDNGVGHVYLKLNHE